MIEVELEGRSGVGRDEVMQRRWGASELGCMEAGIEGTSHASRGIELMTTWGTLYWLCRISKARWRDAMSSNLVSVSNLRYRLTKELDSDKGRRSLDFEPIRSYYCCKW
jgi:hypothetical protein